MKLTLIQPTDVPGPLRDRFGAYHLMFSGCSPREGFAFETIRLSDGQPLPDPATLDGDAGDGLGAPASTTRTIPGWSRCAPSSAAPMPRRRRCSASASATRSWRTRWAAMSASPKRVGASAATSTTSHRAPLLSAATLPEFAIACSHQDQVIVPPDEAETFLASDFTPHAGLVYRNGAAMSLQPHPEFEDDYTIALAELRRGKAPDDNDRDGACVASARAATAARWLGISGRSCSALGPRQELDLGAQHVEARLLFRRCDDQRRDAQRGAWRSPPSSPR